jgi:hypothetical protein
MLFEEHQMLDPLRIKGRGEIFFFNLDRAHAADVASTDVILSNYIASLPDFILFAIC